MNTEDPIQLIQKIVLKDRAAFERFYDRYAGLVFSLALRVLGVRPDAEELTQDVFYQIWRQAERYSVERGRPEAWLVTITRSRAIDRLRANRRRPTEPLDAVMDAGQGPAAAPDLSGDARLSTQELVAGLSPAQRVVIEMAYFDGLTQTQIAARLGEPLGTVKTRLRDALIKLRQLLEKKETVKIR